MDTFQKYEILKKEGLDPSAICLIAEKDGLSAILIVRLLRHLFNLSLHEAKAIVGVDSLLSPKTRKHILNGDEKGGGHAYGVGTSYKYINLEIQLKAILFELKLLMTDSEKHSVEEDIDSKEYGLAFENICSIIERNEISISLRLYGVISELGNSMSMSPNIWETLITH